MTLQGGGSEDTIAQGPQVLADAADGALQPAVVCVGGGADGEHLTGECLVHLQHGGQLRLTPTHHLVANRLLIAQRTGLIKHFAL